MAERRTKLAKTLEGRENQLISRAYDLAEKQLEEGTASAQVITTFLKAGSSRERLEHERLKNENLLIAARIEDMAQRGRLEELMGEALDAMRSYSGKEVVVYDNDPNAY